MKFSDEQHEKWNTFGYTLGLLLVGGAILTAQIIKPNPSLTDPLVIVCALQATLGVYLFLLSVNSGTRYPPLALIERLHQLTRQSPRQRLAVEKKGSNPAQVNPTYAVTPSEEELRAREELDAFQSLNGSESQPHWLGPFFTFFKLKRYFNRLFGCFFC